MKSASPSTKNAKRWNSVWERQQDRRPKLAKKMPYG